MTIKRMLLFASVAFAALPAAAQAEWTHEGELLKGAAEVQLSGTVMFTLPAGLGGNICLVKANLVMLPGKQGAITKPELQTATCEGWGVLEGCEVEKDSTTAPWAVAINEATKHLDMQESTISYVFKAGCPVPMAHLVFPATTIEPDNPEALDFLVATGMTALGVVGKLTFKVIEGKAKTYGII